MEKRSGGINWLAVVIVSAIVSAIVAQVSAMLHELWKEWRETRKRKRQIEAEEKDSEEAERLAPKRSKAKGINVLAAETEIRLEMRLKYNNTCHGRLHEMFDPYKL